MTTPAQSSNPVERISTAAARASGTSANTPVSPHTPQRTVSSSNVSSPSVYRTEEEYVIFEFGTRCLRAGLAGEAGPRACIHFGPSQSRRVGDYREWLPDYKPPDPGRKSTQDWGKEYELWQLDTREEDVGLVEDKLERAVRDAYNRYLLLDPKTRRVAVILPAILPTAYIEKLLTVFYRDFQVPGVALFPSAVMATLASGMRSALVVDIGWNETVVTAVYELRQVDSYRSTRAMKMATLHTARLLSKQWRDGFPGDLEEPVASEGKEEHLSTSFPDAEEALVRMGWCQNVETITQSRRRPRPGAGRQISGSWPSDSVNELNPSSDVSSGTSRSPEDVPFSSFCLPVESSLFANSKPASSLDDHEQPLPNLIHQTMISLPPDVRGTCMSRVIFTGGGSNIPGLKSRLTAELTSLVNDGFDPVKGKAAKKHRERLAEISSNKRKVAQEEASRTQYPANSAGLPAGETPSPIPAGLVMPEIHQFDEKLARDAAKQGSKAVTGIIRVVESLGAWAGTSLAVASRVKAVVDVQADDFLSNGMQNALSPKTADVSVGRVRSFTTGREQKGWTLGLWS